MIFKKYRIIKIGDGKHSYYRVDKRHWFLFIPYWDIGASDMMPYYTFDTLELAYTAIAQKVSKYMSPTLRTSQKAKIKNEIIKAKEE